MDMCDQAGERPAARIRRHFADLPDRQVHCRRAGAGPPRLVLLHGCPGSSRQLEKLMLALAPGISVLAPDMPGYGDSPVLAGMAAGAPPTMTAYAEATLALLDHEGVGEVDLYGTHTGAALAVELAVLAPGRVRRVVLDGLGHYTQAERAAHLARYAPPMAPDQSGAYLQTAFCWVRDLFLFWPWYARDAAHRRPTGLPDAAILHGLVVDMLKSLETYHLGYQASFAYDTAARLPRLRQPVLLLAQPTDPLAACTRAAAGLVRGAVLREPAREEVAAAVAAFLADGA
jgi:pimeloyl-ACP methyl ester carboxylesterase